jgi:SAM-dependent methyltransferase
VTDAPNAEQEAYWNGTESQHWTDLPDKYDEMLAPYLERVVDAAELAAADRVLDVGCGCGATTLAAARRVSTGEAVGIDLSKAMIDRARQRAIDEGLGNARFEVADAQTFKLAVPFNAVVSRFGVMFFADPVAAFRNLHDLLWPGGRIAFACWRDVAHNEWVTVPMSALLQQIPPNADAPGLPKPGEPGPFAFADEGHLRSVLTDAGFADIALATVDDKILVGGHGTLDDAVDFVTHSGMTRRTFGTAAPAVQTAVRTALHASLAPFASDDGVRLGASAWLATARRD